MQGHSRYTQPSGLGQGGKLWAAKNRTFGTGLARSQELCNSCWQPLSGGPSSVSDNKSVSSHPRLFCHQCLLTCSRSHSQEVNRSRNGEASGVSVGHTSDGSLVMPESWCNPHTQKMLEDLIDEKSSRPTRKSRAIAKLNSRFPVREDPDASKREIRLLVYRQALDSFEKKATRCDFCSTSRELRVFCVHCRKRVCSKCADTHAHNPLQKHHATVDLTGNSGLL